MKTIRKYCPVETAYLVNINFLITESAVITGKYLTGGLDSTDRGRRERSVHKRPRSDISSNDQADEVNKSFIIWLFLNKPNILSLVKTYHIRLA